MTTKRQTPPVNDDSTQPPSDNDVFHSVSHLPASIKSSYGTLSPFDDGHVPETFAECYEYHRDVSNDDRPSTNDTLQKSGGNSSRSRSSSGGGGGMVIQYNYDKVLGSIQSNETDDTTCSSSSKKQSLNDPMLHVWNDALPKPLTKQIYEYTANEANNPTWGTYVTIEEALSHLETCACASIEIESTKSNFEEKQSSPSSSKTMREHEIAIAAVAHFLFPGPTITSEMKIIQKNSTNHHNHQDGHKSTTHNSSQEHCVPSSSLPSSLSSSSSSSSYCNIHRIIKQNIQDDKNRIIHGVGVWSLSSSTSQNVPYHIDYAEYIRYKYNIVVPPLFAGTVQCTPYSSTHNAEHIDKCCNNHSYCYDDETNVSMKGGNFAVNLNGWDHYETFGYKGCKRNDSMGGLKARVMSTNNDSLQDKKTHDENIHIDHNTQWVTIPYKFNQGILHTGHLPHLSTIINGFHHCTTNNDNNDAANHEMKRVIMGFNVFSDDIGPLVSKVPEHSESFRRWVKWHRAVVLKNNFSRANDGNANSQTKLTSVYDNWKKTVKLDDLRKNKPLMKLLVLAKREKIKREWMAWQSMMTQFVTDNILQHGDNDKKDGKEDVESTNGRKIAIWKLCDSWEPYKVTSQQGKESNIQPSKDDFLVHVKKLVLHPIIHPFNDQRKLKFELNFIDDQEYLFLLDANNV